MNKGMKLLLICITVLFACSSMTVYAVSPRYMFEYRWSNVLRTLTWNCNFETARREEVRAAMNTWNAVTDSDGTALISAYLSNYVESDNTIGYTMSSLIPVASTTPSFDGNGNLVSMRIVLNQNINCSTTPSPGTVEIQSVVLHELGHALCIMHCHDIGDIDPSENGCGVGLGPDTVMSPEIGTNEIRRTLTWYDIMQYQYGY